MAIQHITRYICDITYQQNEQDPSAPPPLGWFFLNGTYYHPAAQLIISFRIVEAAQQATPIYITPEEATAPATAAELEAFGLPVPPGVE